jgi:hypothetical protein
MIEPRQCPKLGAHPLHEEVLALLFRLDPIGLYEGKRNEYAPVVGTLLPRLRNCHCQEEAQRAVHQELTREFDSDFTGPESRYTPMAKQIWRLWKGRNAALECAAGSDRDQPRH